MLVLAFDTTAAACSVAVVRDGACIGRAQAVADHGQAESLMPMIKGTMRESGIAYADLDRIAVTVGPGSFTGLRIGLAAARALGLAAGKPVIGVSSLEVLAAAVPAPERERNETVLCAIDTKRGDLYLQLFAARDLAPGGEPIALLPSELEQWLPGGNTVVVGDGTGEVLKALPKLTVSAASPLPDPLILARLAAVRTPSVDGPLPLYVLAPKVTLAPGGGRLRQ